MNNYKMLIDSTELQQKILDYIASKEVLKVIVSSEWLLFTECLLRLC